MAYKSTILIVDDDPTARDTLEALLFREGYDLYFATDGPEALEKASHLVPDLVLLDVMMPGMNGFDVCRQLRSDPLLAEVPVLMVTALDDRDSRLHGIEAGADDFVSKPFDRVELRARVRNIIQLNRYRQLLLERSKFEWVVEHAEDGYVIVRDDEVMYANPQARLYLGLPSSGSDQVPADARQYISDSFLELARRQYRCEPEDVWANWPVRQATLPRSPRYLVRPQSPTADAFWLQVDLMEMTTWTENEYLIRLRDVTASVVSQANVWTFQGLVGHKLRTPLTIMTGFIDVLAEDLPKHLDGELMSYFSRAREGALRLQSEVLDILQYVEAPDLVEAELGGCCLSAIPGIVAEINTSLEIQSLAVSPAVEDLDGVQVPISCQVMELILWELLENAKKFHPAGSPTVAITISVASDGVQLQVADDGLTLSPDQLLKMWRPYYQAESGFSGQVPGIGLGLAMVSTLVWRVGGACRAYNREPGPGVVVELALPIERNAAASHEDR
jgi:two-component system cell cycle response regulator